MKRCPQCAAEFPDTFEFCERDGSPLVPDFSDWHLELSEPPAVTDEYQELPDAPAAHTITAPTADPYVIVRTNEYSVSGESRLRQNWKALALMGVAGVAIVLFFVY